MEASLEKKIAELETLIKEKNIKLETYEKLEQELDNVVMEAAQGRSCLCLDVGPRSYVHW